MIGCLDSLIENIFDVYITNKVVYLLFLSYINIYVSYNSLNDNKLRVNGVKINVNK